MSDCYQMFSKKTSETFKKQLCLYSINYTEVESVLSKGAEYK